MKKKEPVKFNGLVYMSMGVMLLIIMDVTLYSDGGWPAPRAAMYVVMTALIVTIIVGFFKISKKSKK